MFSSKLLFFLKSFLGTDPLSPSATTFDDTYLQKLIDILVEDTTTTRDVSSPQHVNDVEGWISNAEIVSLICESLQFFLGKIGTLSQSEFHTKVGRTCFCMRIFALLSKHNQRVHQNLFLETCANVVRSLDFCSSVWVRDARFREAAFLAASSFCDSESLILKDLCQSLCVSAVGRLKCEESYFVQKASRNFLITYLKHSRTPVETKNAILDRLYEELLVENNSEATLEEVCGILLEVSDHCLLNKEFRKGILKTAETLAASSESYWDLIFSLSFPHSCNCLAWIQSKKGKLRMARNHLRSSAGDYRESWLNFLLSEVPLGSWNCRSGRSLRYLTELVTFLSEQEATKVLEELFILVKNHRGLESRQLLMCLQSFADYWNTEKKGFSVLEDVLMFMIWSNLAVKHCHLTEKLLVNQEFGQRNMAGHTELLAQIHESLGTSDWEKRDSALQLLRLIIIRDAAPTDAILTVETLASVIIKKHSVQDTSHFVRATAVACISSYMMKSGARRGKILLDFPETFPELVLKILEKDPDPLPRREAMMGFLEWFPISEHQRCSDLTSQILLAGAKDVDLEVKFRTVALVRIAFYSHKKTVLEVLNILLLDCEVQMEAFNLVRELKSQLEPTRSQDGSAELEEMETFALRDFVEEKLRCECWDVKTEKLLDDMIVSLVGSCELQMDCY